MTDRAFRRLLLCWLALWALPALPAPCPAQKSQPAHKKIQTTARPATAGLRMALVMANGAYKGDLNALEYPVNDAKLMQKVLVEAGFEVSVVTDADQKAMETGIRKFVAEVRARSAAVALCFYSGHGAQVGGKNYLVPLLAHDLSDETDIKYRTVSADEMLDRLMDTGCPLKIMILDACRNDPFKTLRHTKGRDGGLAKMEATTGSLIVYATAPGSVAKDNVFTPLFVQQIRAMHGETFTEVVDATVKAVEKQTDGRQSPWCSFSSGGSFRFFPSDGIRPVIPSDPPAPVKPRVIEPRVIEPNGDPEKARYRLSVYDDKSDPWSIRGIITTTGTKGHSGASFGILDRNSTGKTGVYAFWLGHEFEIESVSKTSLVAVGNGWESVHLGANRGAGSVQGRMRLVLTVNGRGQDTIDITFDPMPGSRHADMAVRTWKITLANSYISLSPQ